MHIKDDHYTRMLQGLAYTVIILGSLACLIPFLLIISASLTANDSIIKDGYHFIPKAILAGRLQDGVHVPG